MPQMKMNPIHLAELVKLMMEGAYSCHEIADQTGLHYVTVLEYTRAMYRKGIAHIRDWDMDARGRHSIKIYQLGEGEDAVPPRRTNSDRSAAYRKKKNQKRMQNALVTLEEVVHAF